MTMWSVIVVAHHSQYFYCGLNVPRVKCHCLRAQYNYNCNSNSTTSACGDGQYVTGPSYDGAMSGPGVGVWPAAAAHCGPVMPGPLGKVGSKLGCDQRLRLQITITG